MNNKDLVIEQYFAEAYSYRKDLTNQIGFCEVFLYYMDNGKYVLSIKILQLDM